jgi:glutathione S-transferase
MRVMLHLYVGSKRYSSWSLRPYLALAHTGAPFQCTTILLDRDTTKKEIAKVTPAGKVPVLHHEGLVIWDSLAICEYVNELHPAAQLWPADRTQRAKARTISAEMHSAFAALRKHMSMVIGETRPPPTDATALVEAARVQTIWEDALAASGGPFLFGAFTIADAMYAPVATRFTSYGITVSARCREYMDALHALPAMKQWTTDAAAEPATRD